MKSILLTSRPCQLGPTINDRTEMHGDEGKPALDLAVTLFCLTAAEFNEIAGHPGAYAGLMDSSTQPPKFAYPNLEPVLALRETVKGCTAVLKLGLENFELHLAEVKLKGGVFELTNTGAVAFAFKLQHEGELTGEQLLKLRAAKGKSIDVELTIGEVDKQADAQQGLNLGEGGKADNSHADGKRRKRSKAEQNPEAIAAGAVWSTLRERWELEDGTPWVPQVGGSNGDAGRAAH